jgi:hypothetical protein
MSVPLGLNDCNISAGVFVCEFEMLSQKRIKNGSKIKINIFFIMYGFF